MGRGKAIVRKAIQPKQEIRSPSNPNFKSPGAELTTVPATTRRSRVRPGCRTCKIRRVKCDETRPACLKCTSTGRQCDGYSSLSITNLPFDIPGDDDERRGYHFFRLRSTGIVLGNQDAKFWNSLLLQAGYSEPAIKHALVAVASLHEYLELPEPQLKLSGSDKAENLRALSLRHYNKAIRAALAAGSKDQLPLDRLLILCLLFNAFENLQSNYGGILTHITAALNLAREWRSLDHSKAMKCSSTPTQSSVELVSEHISPILTRLDVQVSFLTHSREHPPVPLTELADHSRPSIPRIFSSTIEARQCLDHLCNWMFHHLKKGDQHVDSTLKSDMEKRFHDWAIAVDRFVFMTTTRSDVEVDNAVKQMSIYYHHALIVLDTYNDVDELGFDKHTQRFRTLVDIAEDLVSLSDYPDNKPRQSFSFDIAVAPPLAFAAARCREPDIRKKAISLLKVSHKSTWDCENCSRSAEFLARVEEEGLGSVKHCHDVPEENRVRRVGAEVDFDEGMMKLFYVHSPYTADTPMETALLPLRGLALSEGQLVQVEDRVLTVDFGEGSSVPSS